MLVRIFFLCIGLICGSSALAQMALEQIPFEQISGLAFRQMPDHTWTDSRVAQQVSESLAPLRATVTEGANPVGHLAPGESSLRRMIRLATLLDVAEHGHPTSALFSSPSQAALSTTIQRQLQDPNIRLKAEAILNQIEQQMPALLQQNWGKTRVWNSATQQYTPLALPAPDQIAAIRDYNYVQTGDNTWVRMSNHPEKIWRVVGGAKKSFYRFEIFVNEGWKEVLLPDMTAEELKAFTPSEVTKTWMKKKPYIEIPWQVASFGLSVWLYKRMQAMMDPSRPNRYMNEAEDVLKDKDMWAIFGTVFLSQRYVFPAIGKGRDWLMTRLDAANADSFAKDVASTGPLSESRELALRPRFSAPDLKKVLSAVASNAGLIGLTATVSTAQILIDYRQYLDACAVGGDFSIQMPALERIQKLKVCDEGYKMWTVGGKAQQFAPMLLSTSALMLGAHFYPKVGVKVGQYLARAGQSVGSALSELGILSLGPSSAGGVAADATVAATSAAAESAALLFRGFRLVRTGTAVATAAVGGLVNGPVVLTMASVALFDVTLAYVENIIDDAVQVTAVRGSEERLQEQMKKITAASDNAWELPEACLTRGQCLNTVISAMEGFHQYMQEWRGLILRDVRQRQDEWFSYMSRARSQYYATYYLYKDVVDQIRVKRTQLGVLNEKDNSVLYDQYISQGQKQGANQLAVQIPVEKWRLGLWHKDEELPLFRSTPLFGVGGPGLRSPFNYYSATEKNQILNSLNGALEDAEKTDVAQAEKIRLKLNEMSQNTVKLDNDRRLSVIEEARKWLGQFIASRGRQLSPGYFALANSVFEAMAKPGTDSFFIAFDRLKKQSQNSVALCQGFLASAAQDAKKMDESLMPPYCVFEMLAKKMGSVSSAGLGEEWILYNADLKLAEHGIDIKNYPRSSFGTDNRSMSEYLVKHMICGESWQASNEVISSNDGWDLRFKPFRITKGDESGRPLRICTASPSLKTTDINYDVEKRGKVFNGAADLLLRFSDSQFIRQDFDAWWSANIRPVTFKQLVQASDAYKKNVIQAKLRPLLGEPQKGDRGKSIWNYLPRSWNPAEYEKGQVPSDLVPSYFYELNYYFDNILEPMAKTHLLSSEKFLADKKIKDSQNLYILVRDQFLNAYKDLVRMDHKSSQELFERYKWTLVTLRDLEALFNTTSDASAYATGANFVMTGSHQFVSISVLQKVREIVEQTYQLGMSLSALEME